MTVPTFADHTWNLDRNTLPVEARAYIILVDELSKSNDIPWSAFRERIARHIDNLQNGVFGSGPEIPEEIILFKTVLTLYETTVTRRSIRENLAKAIQAGSGACFN